MRTMEDNSPIPTHDRTVSSRAFVKTRSWLPNRRQRRPWPLWIINRRSTQSQRNIIILSIGIHRLRSIVRSVRMFRILIRNGVSVSFLTGDSLRRGWHWNRWWHFGRWQCCEVLRAFRSLIVMDGPCWLWHWQIFVCSLANAGL